MSLSLVNGHSSGGGRTESHPDDQIGVEDPFFQGRRPNPRRHYQTRFKAIDHFFDFSHRRWLIAPTTEHVASTTEHDDRADDCNQCAHNSSLSLFLLVGVLVNAYLLALGH